MVWGCFFLGSVWRVEELLSQLFLFRLVRLAERWMVPFKDSSWDVLKVPPLWKLRNDSLVFSCLGTLCVAGGKGSKGGTIYCHRGMQSLSDVFLFHLLLTVRIKHDAVGRRVNWRKIVSKVPNTKWTTFEVRPWSAKILRLKWGPRVEQNENVDI